MHTTAHPLARSAPRPLHAAAVRAVRVGVRRLSTASTSTSTVTASASTSTPASASASTSHDSRRHASTTTGSAPPTPDAPPDLPTEGATHAHAHAPEAAGQRQAEDLPLLPIIPLDATDPFAHPRAQHTVVNAPPRDKQNYFPAVRPRHMTVQKFVFDRKNPLAEPQDTTHPATRMPPLELARRMSLPGEQSIDKVIERWEKGLMDATELKGKLGLEVYAAIVGRPWHLTRLSNLQRLVLTQLPGIANPKGVPVVPRKGKGRGGKAPLEQPGRDVLMIAAPNAGAKLAYIVPAVEHRLRSIKRFVADALARGGLHTDPATEERAAKIFTRGHAGVVIVTPTKERATEIGNQVLKTVHNHHEFQVQMLAGGVARKIQMRDWMQGRRDVVVGTPGRIRSLLEGEDEFARGMAKATMLIMDDTATALSLGLRDDLDAIAAYVAPREKRQTWIHTNELNLPLRQMVKSMLDEDYLVFKDLGVEKEVQPWEQVEQYHTVLPSGRDQLPHICRLIAHDQLANPGKSKVVIFTSGARVAQLFTTFLRALADSLPGGKDTNFYELHSGLTAQEREDVAQAWREDRSGCSVLLSSDFALKAEQYGTCTRVIQVGIPASSDVFKARLSRLADKGVKPRADLVLLNWEIGFLTWMLGEHPLKPCTTGRLQEEVEQKAAAFDADPAAVFPEDFALQEKRGLVPGEFTKFEGSVSERIKSVEKLYEELLPKMDELAIKETFASLLGFYIPKAGELRAQRPVIVQGVKQWAKECCGLAEEPYVSPEFLRRLGMDDGRTRHFGAAWLDRVRGMPVTPFMMKPTYKPGGAWLGRGIQRLKDRQVEERSWAGGAAELDPNDPVADPEMYRSTPYGKRADLAGRLLVPEEVKKSQQLAAIKAARKEMGLPVADLRTNPLEAEQSVNLPPLPRERRPAFGREHPEFAGFSAPQGASRAWPGGRSDSVAGMPFAAPSSVDAANLPFGESRPREAPRGPRRKEDGSSSRSGGGW